MSPPQSRTSAVNENRSSCGKALLIAAFMAIISSGGSSLVAAGDATPDEMFNAGTAAFQSANYAEAAKNFEGILKMSPTGDALEMILFTLGATYLNEKNTQKAEEFFNRCVKEFPQGKNRIKALVAISQIQMKAGRKEEAEKTLKLASQGGGDLAERAKIAQAALLDETGKHEEAAGILRQMISSGIKDDLTVGAAMSLLQIESRQGNLDEALKLLEQLQAVANLVDNPLQLDMLAVQIGDALLAKAERRKALRMYAIVRPKEMVMSLQAARIAALEKQASDNKASLQTNPKAFMEVNAANAKIQADIAELRKILDQFVNMPDTLVPVRIRQAKAYDELDQKWETILIWENLLEGKDQKVREDALFSIGAAYVSLGRADDAVTALDRYLKEFPAGKYVSQAEYLKGVVALQGGDFARSESIFGKRLAAGDSSALAAEMQFLLANCQFAQAADPDKRDKYLEAVGNYKKYLTKFPTGKFAQESFYRIPLALFQKGDYGKALEGFQDYIKKYPNGDFLGDADYRIALCYNAAEKYDQVITLCNEWMKKHEGESMQAEVYALEGDAYASKEMPAESAAAYRKSVDFAESEELLKYSLFEANKQYQKINRWDEIADLFSRFAERHPEHPAATAAVYWVSKAKIREGKADEAKQYLAATILKTINDRRKDAVEQLLGQLAQTCSKRPRRTLLSGAAPASPTATNAPVAPRAANAASAPGSPAGEAAPPPAPSPTPLPPYDADADFAKYLNESNVGTNPLAMARLRYAQAQLAGFTKKQEKQAELMTSIYRDYPADGLSAMLLAQCGEIALSKGEYDKAESFYKELMTSFPKSDLKEYAYFGMGEIALARNNPEEALRWFDDAVEKAAAEAKLAQVTYGKGKALLALGKLDEAKKIFEQVAGTKEWRGEVTARALLSLGEIEEKKGNTAGACQYYQRVFVAYQRYPELVITSYIKAADCFIKLNEPEKAAAHLREMLSKPRLASLPSAAEARKKLESLPPAPSPSGPSPTPATP